MIFRLTDCLKRKQKIEEVHFIFTWCLSHAEFRFPHLYLFKEFDLQEKREDDGKYFILKIPADHHLPQ